MKTSHEEFSATPQKLTAMLMQVTEACRIEIRKQLASGDVQ
jgi:hypothetical protein